jgi:hypothetical protein
MKAVVSGFAVLAFLATSTLPIQTYAQTGNTPTMAPDTGGGAAPSSTTKKPKSSKSHSKKKSKKSTPSHASAAKSQHHSMNAAKRTRHTII